MTLGLLQLGFFIFLIIRYFLLNLVILRSNETIHEDMIHGLVRSPCWYFDITPSGRLTNKFSNDLGIMDNLLIFSLTESIEGFIVCLVMIANIFQINVYFIIPGVIYIAFVTGYYLFCKGVIVNVKQLDLRMKSPVFNMVSEMMSGLVQIRIFKRRFGLLK